MYSIHLLIWGILSIGWLFLDLVFDMLKAVIVSFVISDARFKPLGKTYTVERRGGGGRSGAVGLVEILHNIEALIIFLLKIAKKHYFFIRCFIC